MTRDGRKDFRSNKTSVNFKNRGKQAEEEKDELHAAFLVFAILVVYILCTCYDIYYKMKPGTLNFLQQNGRLATLCFFYLVFIFGYFPEHYRYWLSGYKKLTLHHSLTTKEKTELSYLSLGIICIVVFFGLVDFSFLGVKGGIPQIGSVAALSIMGLLGNIYRLRKANRQERKRKREHAKHIEEIRSRRNSPSGKQK